MAPGTPPCSHAARPQVKTVDVMVTAERPPVVAGTFITGTPSGSLADGLGLVSAPSSWIAKRMSSDRRASPGSSAILAVGRLGDACGELSSRRSARHDRHGCAGQLTAHANISADGRDGSDNEGPHKWHQDLLAQRLRSPGYTGSCNVAPIQAEAGKGNTASVRSTRDAIRHTIASYAISGERGARKNALDNEQ